jgi:hypothetical protein
MTAPTFARASFDDVAIPALLWRYGSVTST